MIIVESVLPVAPETTAAENGLFHQDVIMLAHNPGGKERTHKDLEALAKGPDFPNSELSIVFTTLGSWNSPHKKIKRVYVVYLKGSLFSLVLAHNNNIISCYVE